MHAHLPENLRDTEGTLGRCDCSPEMERFPAWLSLLHNLVSSLSSLILPGTRPVPSSSDLFDTCPDGAKA